MKHYNKILFYDLETNGFFSHAGTSQPIEIAIFGISDDNIIVYNKLFLPPNPIPEKITEITSITQEMLDKDGKCWDDEVTNINHVLNCKDALIVGHNHLRFDNKFVNQLFNKYDEVDEVPIHNCFDTGGEFKAELLERTKEDFEDFHIYHTSALNKPAKGVYWNLTAAAGYYGITIPANLHRAMSDTKLTAKVFLKQIDKYLGTHITINENVLKQLKLLLDE